MSSIPAEWLPAPFAQLPLSVCFPEEPGRNALERQPQAVTTEEVMRMGHCCLSLCPGFQRGLGQPKGINRA